MVKVKTVVYSIFNTIVLIILTTLLQYQPYLDEDEELIITINKFIKAEIIGSDYKPPSDGFLFINTAYDNQLAIKYDASGYIPLGNEAITDRQKLAEFFEILIQEASYKYIICDIFFEYSTDNDASLDKVIHQLPRIIIPFHLNEDGSPDYPIFKNVKQGLATIETLNETFLKYRLAYADTLHTLPLVVYESLYKTRYEQKWPFSRLGEKLVIDYFIPEYRITNYDLLVNPKYTLVNLGDLLILDNTSINELAKDRLIVIGDFTEHDKVEIAIGEISGPLLLTNVLLALENGDICITATFFLFISLSYFLLSLSVFHPHDHVGNFLNRFNIGGGYKKFILGIGYVFILGFISSASSLIFHLYINLFFLAIYFFLFDLIRKRIVRKKSDG